MALVDLTPAEIAMVTYLRDNPIAVQVILCFRDARDDAEKNSRRQFTNGIARFTIHAFQASPHILQINIRAKRGT